MQVIFAARLLRSGDVWQPHPGVRTVEIRWRKLAAAVFGTVRVATESVPIPGAFSQQPKRDTRAAVVLLALGYKPRRRHQD